MRGSGICVLATGRQTVRVVTRAILLAAVAVLAACTQESAERDTTAVSADAKTVGRCSDATITDDRVGAVRVGMSVDSLRHECPIIRDTTEMAEGEPGRVIDVLAAGDTLRAAIANDSVRVIAVRRPSFATADSIHVGMPLSRCLIGRHPRMLIGEGRVFLRVEGHCGNSFGLSREAYQRLPALEESTLADLPATTVIDEILVLGGSTHLPGERCVP